MSKVIVLEVNIRLKRKMRTLSIFHNRLNWMSNLTFQYTHVRASETTGADYFHIVNLLRSSMCLARWNLTQIVGIPLIAKYRVDCVWFMNDYIVGESIHRNFTSLPATNTLRATYGWNQRNSPQYRKVLLAYAFAKLSKNSVHQEKLF